jgi:NAD(P)-dependent dehydrogenase (short-subunit alcohol dehydrogenase family)
VINRHGENAVKDAVRQVTEAVAGASVDGIAADLATNDGVTQFLRRVGDADILVNNLGISSRNRSRKLPTPTGIDSSRPI